MPGYATPVITRHFPELVEDGDDVWVTIRNPRLMAPGEMLSTADGVQTGPDGEVQDLGVASRASFKLAAKLIIGWRMYDATFIPQLDPQGEPVPGAAAALLPPVPGPADVAKAPMAVFNWLGEQMATVNPQQTPANPEGTSGTS